MACGNRLVSRYGCHGRWLEPFIAKVDALGRRTAAWHFGAALMTQHVRIAVAFLSNRLRRARRSG